MAHSTQSPTKQLARLSAGELKSALPKLQRRIDEINAIDPSQAVGTFTPEFSAITDMANSTLMEIFGPDSIEYGRFKILSIYTGRNSYARQIPRHEVVAGYTEGRKRALIKIDSAIKFINEKLAETEPMSENTSKEEEWISATGALAMLGMSKFDASTICIRAHRGWSRRAQHGSSITVAHLMTSIFRLNFGGQRTGRPSIKNGRVATLIHGLMMTEAAFVNRLLASPFGFPISSC